MTSTNEGTVAPTPPPPPHNLTSRKARARAQRTLESIARLRPPLPLRTTTPDGGNGGGGDGDDSRAATEPADTAIEARARAAPTVAAFCGCSAAIPDLPWPNLPQPADPSSVLAPSHRLGARGRKKRAQVANFAAVLRRLVELLRQQSERSTTTTNPAPHRPLRVVDFGCGSGAVVLALAALFPPDEAQFVGVDMKFEAIDLLRKRAAEAGLAHVQGVVGMAEDFCWGCSGSDDQTTATDASHTFDVALALHACGNATDVAIELAARSGAAFAVSPCCLGKLRFSARGGSSFHPTLRVLQSTRRGAGERLPPLSEAIAAQEAREAAVAEERRRRGCPWALAEEAEGGSGRVRVRHPRSRWLRGQLLAEGGGDGDDGVDVEAFSAIARAADGVNHGELRVVAEAVAAATTAGAGSGPPQDGALELRAARAAKAVVEVDRAEAVREAHGFAVALLRLSPVEGGGEEEGRGGGDVGARDDLLLGVPGRESKAAAAERWAAAREALSNL